MVSFRLEDLRITHEKVKVFRGCYIPLTSRVSSDRTLYVRSCDSECDCEGEIICNCEDDESPPECPSYSCPCERQRGF